MIRAFLALQLPQHIRSQLLLQQFLLPVPRRVPPENFHVTLVFLGECRGPELEELHHALTSLRLPELQLQIKGIGLFGKAAPHNLHARVPDTEPLARVQARLSQAARSCGFDLPSRRFVPHVTLAYLRPGGFAPGELQLAVARAADFATDTFTVSEYALMRSVLRSDGAQYDVLETYPLGVSPVGLM